MKGITWKFWIPWLLALVVLGITLSILGCNRSYAESTAGSPFVVDTASKQNVADSPLENQSMWDMSWDGSGQSVSPVFVEKCPYSEAMVQEMQKALSECCRKCGKTKYKNSFNIDNSQYIKLKDSYQMLAQDNARLKADSAVMAGQIKSKDKEITDLKQKDIGNTEVTNKKSGNEDSFNRKKGQWWHVVLIMAGAYAMGRFRVIGRALNLTGVTKFMPWMASV